MYLYIIFFLFKLKLFFRGLHLKSYLYFITQIETLILQNINTKYT